MQPKPIPDVAALHPGYGRYKDVDARHKAGHDNG